MPWQKMKLAPVKGSPTKLHQSGIRDGQIHQTALLDHLKHSETVWILRFSFVFGCFWMGFWHKPRTAIQPSGVHQTHETANEGLVEGTKLLPVGLRSTELSELHLGTKFGVGNFGLVTRIQSP